MMTVYALVIFFILVTNMVVWLTSIFLFALSTTQPSFVSSSASCAGVAAAAGEVAKDEKHLATVEKVGSDFIPLVQTFAVWTQFALKTLYAIADRTTLIVEFTEKWPGGICHNNCQCNCG